MNIGGYYSLHDFHWELIGERTVTGEGPWLVSQPLRATSSLESKELTEGIQTLTIVEDDDGVLRVSRDVFLAFRVLDE